ncbi:hypothetical protein BDR04DRAFT_1093206, partial [Suillus decipiens]
MEGSSLVFAPLRLTLCYGFFYLTSMVLYRRVAPSKVSEELLRLKLSPREYKLLNEL